MFSPFIVYCANFVDMALSTNMVRLFDDMSNSPDHRSSSDTWSDFDIDTIVTPLSKRDNSTKSFSPLLLDEDSGLGMEMDAAETCRPHTVPVCLEDNAPSLDGTENFSIFRRPSSLHHHRAKRSLFASKRSADLNDNESSPTMKKHRNSEVDLRNVALTNFVDRESEEVQSIIRAVEKLSTKTVLIADGSKDYILPTLPGKHTDLKSVSVECVARLLNGEFGDLLDRTRIIDCRYPYEYKGGHIKGAVNMYTKDEIERLLGEPATSKPLVLIFYCEFSSERGPKMYRFLRNQDRTRNQDNYPVLNFPEVYLLEGGYQKFYAGYKTLCDPDNYKPMLHQDHSYDLRQFRAKSKSWGGNQKKSSRSRLAMGRSLSFNI